MHFPPSIAKGSHVMQVIYSGRPGSHNVAIVSIPTVFPNTLLHLSQDAQQSWVLRNYILGYFLRRSPDEPNNRSQLSLEKIENEVYYQELVNDKAAVPYLNVTETARWKEYLVLRSMAVFDVPERKILSGHQPLKHIGSWQPLREETDAR